MLQGNIIQSGMIQQPGMIMQQQPQQQVIQQGAIIQQQQQVVQPTGIVNQQMPIVQQAVPQQVCTSFIEAEKILFKG